MQNKNGFFYRIICGFLLGLSIVAPGISGSVLAVMLGIYKELLTIASSPFRNLKKNIIYLIPMGIGAAISGFSFIVLFDYLFENFPVPTYLLFIVLIAGSFPTVYKEAVTVKNYIFKKRYILYMLLAFAVAAATGILEKRDVTSFLGSDNVLYFALCGAIAGAVSVVPGMSVSMILILLGVYQPMMSATKNFEVFTMAPVAVCFAAGIVLTSKLIKYIFDHYKSTGYFTVMGFMAGSIIAIFPGLPSGISQWLVSVLMVAAGIFASILLMKLGKKYEHEIE